MCGWYDEDISKIGQQVPESDRRISGKREAGGKPARSRHCKQGAPDYAHVKTAWQPLVFGDREGNLMCGELRARKPAGCWYRSIPDHEDLVVPYDLYKDFLRLFHVHYSWYVPVFQNRLCQ